MMCSIVRPRCTPPFANTLFHVVDAGDPSLTLAFDMWDKHGQPLVGLSADMSQNSKGALRDAQGNVIGKIRIKAPHGAEDFEFVPSGPSTLVNAFVTGTPVGRLAAVLSTAAGITGDYEVVVSLNGGNEVRHLITAN